MEHGQILDPPYYSGTTNNSNSNLMSAIDFTLSSHGFQQYNNPQDIPVQQQPYSQIDFFYETPHLQNTNNFPISNNSTNFQIPISNNVLTSNTNSTTSSEILESTKSIYTTTNNSNVDEDYVQNLTNELQHTKLLLKQYQIRTEQLMELVKKQTDKISELREQISSKNTQ